MSDKETITLKSAVDAYLAHLAETGTKATTVKVYDRALELALSYFGAEKKLTAIMVSHVGKYFASDLVNKHENGKPKAEPTIKQIKRVFRQCMGFAKEKNWIIKSPIPKTEQEHARNKEESQKSPAR